MTTIRICSIAFGVITLVIFLSLTVEKKYYFYAPSAYNVRNPQLRVVSPRKKILFGNNFYSYHAWGIGLGNEPFHRLKCEVKNCEFTDNLADFNMSDAVLFHIHQLAKKPPHRFFSKQRWIFWMLESPGWSKNMNYKEWNGVFNWTMTYRLDSDISNPYGNVKKKEIPSVKQWKEETWTKRTKEVAWMVSNCDNLQSKRQNYVKQLQR